MNTTVSAGMVGLLPRHAAPAAIRMTNLPRTCFKRVRGLFPFLSLGADAFHVRRRAHASAILPPRDAPQGFNARGLGKARRLKLQGLRMAARHVVAGLWMVGAAYAAPPPGANPDSEIARWVRTTRDHRGWGCCDEADCRPTVARISAAGHYEVWIGRDAYGASAPDEWMPVSAEAMASTSDGPPPDGHVWACFYGGEVKCFFATGAG